MTHKIHPVIRPGVRIVSEQFAPYDNSPDPAPEPLTFAQLGRVFGSIGNQFLDAFTNANGKVFVSVHTGPPDPLKDLEEAVAKFSNTPVFLGQRLSFGYDVEWEMNPPESPPPFNPGKAINKKGKPKKPKQDEPAYVNLTKKMRR